MLQKTLKSLGKKKKKLIKYIKIIANRNKKRPVICHIVFFFTSSGHLTLKFNFFLFCVGSTARITCSILYQGRIWLETASFGKKELNSNIY
jgi:hypothetical protein